MLMKLAFYQEDVFRIAIGAMVRELNWTQLQEATWEGILSTIQ